ncbi:hypothetical protein C2E23DRAFT_891296 [Lenzites betulinus]|nr:hypothetical protein C2E23DRAFT_891296 [Lenzites betulinus]
MTSRKRISSPCYGLPDVVAEVSRPRFATSVETILHESPLLANNSVEDCMNIGCAIDKVPPEILIHIFSFVPRALSPVHSSHSSRWTYDLIPLTHVCRRWRDLALSTSLLWSTLCETARTQMGTPIFRARARNAPLIVYVDGPQASTALVNVLAHDASTVAELRLLGLQAAPATRLTSELLAFPAPRLEHATIRCRASYGGSDDPLDYNVELWSGMAPCLKTLELHDFPFIPTNHFQSLTTLALSWEATPAKCTFTDLAELLGRAPVLEHLSLRSLPSDFHLREPLQTPASPPIVLPCLRSLEVGDCSDESCSVPLMRHMLSSLAIPPGASVRLYGLVARKLSSSLDLTTSLFPQDMQSCITLDLTFSQLALSVADLQTSTTLRLDLETGGATRAALEQAITAFLHSSVAPSVREVVVRGERRWSTWCDPAVLLALLPRVRSVELLHAHLVYPVLAALRPMPVETVPGVDSSMRLCPDLEILRVPPPFNGDLVQQFAQDHRKARVYVG